MNPKGMSDIELLEVLTVADKLFEIAMDTNPATISQQLAASIFILKTQGDPVLKGYIMSQLG